MTISAIAPLLLSAAKKMSIPTMLLELTEAFGVTLLIFAFTLLGALPLGMIVYFGKKSRIAPLRWFINGYISVMRGTPLMLQLIVVYFAPNLVFHLSLPSNWRMIAVVIAFIINYSAYFAEIYRAGIESIPVGQYEAAQVLGYNKVQTFFKIILPQMIKRVIPPVTNEIITLVKDTSLSSAIAVMEMFTLAKKIANSPGSPGMITLFAAGVFYYVFNYLVAFVMRRIEKRLDYFE
jgi:polar amino acid transport system permease protein